MSRSGDTSAWKNGRLGKTGGKNSAPQIVFAQVREDAAIELEVLRSRPKGETVFCIASGGCTALALLLAEPAAVHAVDINPAQIYFLELKKPAIVRLPYKELASCLLVNAAPHYASLRGHISPEAQKFWDENDKLLVRGLNNCGLIESRLRQLRSLLPLVQSGRNLHRLYQSRSLRNQGYVYQNYWNHWRWRLAFKVLLSKPVLGRVYGKEFVRAVPPFFDLTLKNRIGESLTQFPIHENGYTSQLLFGQYPRNEAGWPLYLQPDNHGAIRAGLDFLHLTCEDAAVWLEKQAPASIGFFALSNILEIASPRYTSRLMAAVTRAAKPGAKICLRAIFPFPKSWEFEGLRLLPSVELEKKDRSFFCRNLRVLERE